MNTDWFFDYQTLFFFLNIPISAFIAKISFFRQKKFNYVEHLVIMAYVVGQFTITSTLLIILSSALGLNFYLIGNLLNILLIVYTMITYKKLFAINMKETMIGTLLFFLILTITFIAGSVLWAFYLYQSGAFENLN